MSLPDEPRVRAPELSGGRDWLNTEKPLSLEALKGKVVLLDFWTYGCINCIHIIPDLKRLEAKYAKQLVVIGVHSAKFSNERNTENIRRIILRYGVEHPVVNDADFRIWNTYAVRAWPTQVLIDPAGYIVGKASGEGNYEVIDSAIAQLVEVFGKRGQLNETPLKTTLERAKVGSLPLAFPGKVLADEKSGRLFISDSNHNRVVITRLDGTLIDVVGSGIAANTDGAFDRASFNRPQGLALEGDALYVADTENHTIRRVDLKTRTVTTLAGTGQQSSSYLQTPAQGLQTALNSPWDLQLNGRTLYIAMAGPHQIWKMDLDTGLVSTYAGSGREAREDGPLTDSAFAQPSGLAFVGSTLYVADSEANIVRAIETDNGNVKTVAGGDLFDFGDEDGKGDSVRLQHPLGLALAADGRLFLADTYNHKIKVVDPGTRSVKTFAGTGKPGQADGASPSFYEPGGLSSAQGKLFIADTNNHAIRVVNLSTRAASTLKINGLKPPALEDVPLVEESTDPNKSEQSLPLQRLSVDSAVSLIADVRLPEGYHLNPDAPQRYSIVLPDGQKQLAAQTSVAGSKRGESFSRLPVQVDLKSLGAGKTEIKVKLSLVYCREDNTGTCHIRTLVWRVPVEVVPGATPKGAIRLNANLSE